MRSAAHNEMTIERFERLKYLNSEQCSSSRSQELVFWDVVAYGAHMDASLTHKPHLSFI